MFENLIRVGMNELQMLDAAYAGKEEFSDTDAKKMECLAHGLSCLMKSLPYIEEYGYDQDHSISGRRGRSPDTGRYVSMDSRHTPPEGPPGWSGYPGYYRNWDPDPRYWR